MCHMCRLLLLVVLTFGFIGLGLSSNEEEENEEYYFPEFEYISIFLQPLTQQVQNEKCRQQLDIYLKSLKNSSLWAVQMLDASGKIPQGLLTSDAYNLGNYDGCIDINLKRDNQDNIYGKYCLATLKVNNKNNFPNYRHRTKHIFTEPEFSAWDKLLVPIFRYGFINNTFRTGICVPDKCSHQDVEDILLYLYNNTTKLNFEGVTVSVPKNACSTKEDKETLLSSIIHQIIFGLFFGVTAITSFDLLGWLDIPIVRELKFLQTLSAYRNFRSLTSTNVQHIPCLDSLRIYTVILHVVCRRLSYLIDGPIINRKISDQIYNEEFKKAFFEMANTLVAETFLFLNGFLAYYKVTGYFKQNSKLSIFRVYVAEYLKTIPLLISAILYYIYAFETIGDGPMWKERTEVSIKNCQRNWMINFLNLNNLIPSENICIFETCFFTVIAHCFLTVPIVAKSSSTTAVSTLGLLTVVSFILPYYNSTFTNEKRSSLWFTFINVATINRAFPYFCGMWCSLFYLRIRKSSWKVSKETHKIFCLLSLSLSLLTFWGNIFHPSTPLTFLLIRLFYSFAIFWVIIGVSTNKLPLLAPILNKDHFTPLARLTYPYLLIIGLVQLYTVATIRTLDYLSVPRLIWMSSADFLSTTVFAFVFYMMIHKPFVTTINTNILQIYGSNPNTTERKRAAKTSKIKIK